MEMTDGYDWELKLRDRNGRANTARVMKVILIITMSLLK